MLLEAKPLSQPSHECVPPTTLCTIGSDRLTVLLDPFTVSLRSPIFVTQWKTSPVYSLKINGSLHRLFNDHPINPASLASKLMKQIAKQRMWEFRLSQNLIHIGQPGFLNSRPPITVRKTFSISFLMQRMPESYLLIFISD